MTPSSVYKLTLSPAVAELVEQHRGVLSVQEFILAALLDKCNGSAAEHQLRDELERMHETLRSVLQSSTSAPAPAPARAPAAAVAPRAAPSNGSSGDTLDW